jgi:tetratricopeptide (TPR) repeat protein
MKTIYSTIIKNEQFNLTLEKKWIKAYRSEENICDEIIESSITYWLEQDPTNYYNFTWAEKYLSKEKYIDFLEKAIEQEKNIELINLLITEDYYKKSKLTWFLKIFENFDDINEPEKKAIIYNRLGIYFFKDNKEKEAIIYYNRAIELDESKPIYRCNLGRAYANLGEWDKALTSYTKSVELKRNNPDDSYGLDYYYEFLSEACFKTDRIEEFIANFESSGDIKNEPEKKAVIYDRIGVLYFEANQAKESIPHYERAIELDVSKPIYHCNLGRAYAKLGEWDKALPYYNKALEIRRNTPEDCYGLAYYYEFLSEAYFKTDRLNEFLKLFKNTEDFNNEPEPKKKALVFNRIGILFFEDNKEKEAITYYDEAIKLDEIKPIFNSNLGLVYAKLGEWDKALTYYNKAVELRRNNPNDSYGLDYYYEFLSEAYYKTGRLNEFLKMLESSGDFNNEPNQKAVIFNRIGVLLFEDFKEEEAIKYYEKAIDCDTSKPVFNSNLGLAYTKLGEWDKALTYYSYAVELRRNNPNDFFELEYYNNLLTEAQSKTSKKV